MHHLVFIRFPPPVSTVSRHLQERTTPLSRRLPIISKNGGRADIGGVSGLLLGYMRGRTPYIYIYIVISYLYSQPSFHFIIFLLLLLLLLLFVFAYDLKTYRFLAE